jgi:PBP1b-binding outer membrane lipoprotein LpoB
MKLKLMISTLMISALFASGCQQSTEHQHTNHSEEAEVKAPKVEILAKEHTNPNQQETISANVYYGEELVDDAEVTFEIKKGEEESEKILAELTDTGTYSVNYTFDEPGVYQVTAHTNVKGYHTMPTTAIQVGEGT